MKKWKKKKKNVVEMKMCDQLCFGRGTRERGTGGDRWTGEREGDRGEIDGQGGERGTG